jgi:hypothetical protein
MRGCGDKDEEIDNGCMVPKTHADLDDRRSQCVVWLYEIGKVCCGLGIDSRE